MNREYNQPTDEFVVVVSDGDASNLGQTFHGDVPEHRHRQELANKANIKQLTKRTRFILYKIADPDPEGIFLTSFESDTSNAYIGTVPVRKKKIPVCTSNSVLDTDPNWIRIQNTDPYS